MEEYESCLRASLDAGFEVISLETWMEDPDSFTAKTLLLRHDVDSDPHSAWLMSEVERNVGVNSTFYFRWCTFDVETIRFIRQNGSHVGFHHETLTHYALKNGLRTPESITPEAIVECRAQLSAEIRTFKEISGGCRSAAAHGDKRAVQIGCNNAALLRGEDCTEYGLDYCADSPHFRQRISCWVADGNMVDSFWMGDKSLPDALVEGSPPILFNTHPHHWRNGAVVVSKRFTENLLFLLKHPLAWERGKPEAFARRLFLREPVDGSLLRPRE